MNMKNKNLIKVSTYATHMGISTMAVYKQIDRGVIEHTQIDGVTFVVVDDNTMQKIIEKK